MPSELSPKETSESRSPYEELGLAANETSESLREFGDAVREALPYYTSIRGRLETFLDTLLSWNPIGLSWEALSFCWRWIRRKPPERRDVAEAELWINARTLEDVERSERRRAFVFGGGPTKSSDELWLTIRQPKTTKEDDSPPQ